MSMEPSQYLNVHVVRSPMTDKPTTSSVSRSRASVRGNNTRRKAACLTAACIHFLQAVEHFAASKVRSCR